MDMKPIILRAKEILATPDRWTKGNYARTADGRERFYYDPSAACWCTLGAIRKAADELEPTRSSINAEDAFCELTRDCVPSDYRGDFRARVAAFNDTEATTFEQVHALLDCALGKVA